MKEQIENAITFLKSQQINGCITGSCLLDYFENQDIDLFVYDEQSLVKILFAMYYNDKFQLLEEIEKWKFEEYINKGQSSIKKLGLLTIKFKYNLCVDVNVIFKKASTNIFSVLSSFDLNIICKGFDIKSQKVLDLTENPGKIADWNKWNLNFYPDADIWSVSRLLRQLERCFKYHKRGYNTDKVVLKYIEIINQNIKYKNIFKSESFDERINNFKDNLKIILEICQNWLKTHEISEKEIELLRKKVQTI